MTLEGRGPPLARFILTLAPVLALASCMGGANGVAPPTETRPLARAMAAPNPLATPVNAGIDAMVATMDNSTLAVQGAAIAAYAQHYEIHTIFLELSYGDYHTKLPKGDPATVAALDGLFAVADVYMIAGNEKWQLTPDVVPAEIKDLLAVGAAHPQFKGLAYDQEPETLPGWQTNRQAIITQYVQFLKFLLVSPGGYAYKTTLIAVAPYYEHLPDSQGNASPSLFQEVESLPTVSGTYVTDFYAPPAAQMRNVSQAALAQIQKPFWWGSTTNANDAPGVSYYGTPEQTFIADMSELRSLVAPRNSNLAGLFVNAWNSEDTSLQTVLPPP